VPTCTQCNGGNLASLRWSNLDFERATLQVAQQVTEDDTRKVIIAPYTKSDDGDRLLPLPPYLIEQLQWRQELNEAEQRIFQKRLTERAEARGEPIPIARWNPDNLVFCSEVGTMIQPSNFNRRFAALVKRLKLPEDTTPHSLRHTALTDLAAHGEAKAVQNIAGHADIDTTMRLYAGRRMTAMRAAVEAVEKARKAG
jgi:integrase